MSCIGLFLIHKFIFPIGSLILPHSDARRRGELICSHIRSISKAREKNMLAWIPVLWSAVSILHFAEASHFRGGITMLRPVENPVNNEYEMEISFFVSWRRTSSPGGNCDQTVVDNEVLLSNDDLICMSGCSSINVARGYYCTAFSVEENWSFGDRFIDYDFSNYSNTVITIGFQGYAWMSPFSSAWSVPTTISLTKRPDIGRINSTPRAITAPVVKLLENCVHNMHLAVMDPDNDIVRCRWAVGFLECGGICNAFRGAVLDEANCIITYNAINGTGLMVPALMIEDFLPGSNTPMSSVALQFVVEVYSSSEPCSSQPDFTPNTLPQRACVAVPPNTDLQMKLEANSGKAGETITSFTVIGPVGLVKSAIFPVAQADVYAINVTWTPTPSQLNKAHILCYFVKNSLGLTSPQSCVNVMAGMGPPYLVESYPSNRVHPKDVSIDMKFDQGIQRSPTPAKLTIRDYQTDELFIEFDLLNSPDLFLYNLKYAAILQNLTFPEKKTFYVELESGAFLGFGCELASAGVYGKDAWKFTTMDITPPIIHPITMPAKISGIELLEWKVNEPAEVTCQVDGGEFEVCADGEYTIYSLELGMHYFVIQAIDLEMNYDIFNHTFEIVEPEPPCASSGCGMNIKNEININF
ncbi:hypothetical protein SK128_019271 [Halocaridina rubra]|uniref:Uncharacterized protein n=1 Tax=Halocaridina rubra TaxID=373956 RepID=A0AAN8WHZ7_HALRR